jgi:GDP-mannose 6-dehydrogenase
VDRIDQVLEHAETIVIGNDDPDFAGVLEDLRAGQRVVDLVRCRPKRRSDGEYDGICW